jgi:hypothetical protein
MKPASQNWMRKRFRAGILSPSGLVLRALLIALAFGLCELCGLRQHTTFISGTTASPEIGLQASAVLGTVYLVFYFGFVLLTPILLLAAAFLALAKRWLEVPHPPGDTRT